MSEKKRAARLVKGQISPDARRTGLAGDVLGQISGHRCQRSPREGSFRTKERRFLTNPLARARYRLFFLPFFI
jgi:hypothetical protein